MKEKGGLKKLVMIITDQPVQEDDSKKLAKKESGSRAGKKSAKDGKIAPSTMYSLIFFPHVQLVFHL